MRPFVRTRCLVLAAAIVPALALAGASACGRSETGRQPVQPSPDVPIITLSSSGASPKTMQIAVGSRVRFVNADNVARTINSDPHPEHDRCPELNQVGFLAPGHSRETGNFVQPDTCGFHDQAFADEAFRGRIIIR